MFCGCNFKKRQQRLLEKEAIVDRKHVEVRIFAPLQFRLFIQYDNRHRISNNYVELSHIPSLITAHSILILKKQHIINGINNNGFGFINRARQQIF